MQRDKVIGFFMGGLIGDVLGSQVEGKPSKYIKEKYGLVKDIDSKRYTDDMEMSVVLTRHILKKRKEFSGDIVVSDELLMDFAKEAKKYNYRGYSLNTRNILIKALEGVKINNNSTTNGCLMRIGTIGIFGGPEENFVSNIKKSMLPTHGMTKDGFGACYVHCKTINTIIENLRVGPVELFNKAVDYSRQLSTNLYLRMKEVSRALNRSEEVDIGTKISGKIDFFQIEAIDLLACAYYYFFKFWSSPELAICKAVSAGGDSDTVAKIVGELCGALHGYSWIPQRWKGLENEKEIFSMANDVAMCVDQYDPKDFQAVSYDVYNII